MKFWLAVPVICALMLPGCSSRVQDEADAAARQAAREPARAAFKPDPQFCQSVARGQISDSFDDATRARMYADNYRQCMATLGISDSGLHIAGTAADAPPR